MQSKLCGFSPVLHPIRYCLQRAVMIIIIISSSDEANTKENENATVSSASCLANVTYVSYDIHWVLVFQGKPQG